MPRLLCFRKHAQTDGPRSRIDVQKPDLRRLTDPPAVGAFHFVGHPPGVDGETMLPSCCGERNRGSVKSDQRRTLPSRCSCAFAVGHSALGHAVLAGRWPSPFKAHFVKNELFPPAFAVWFFWCALSIFLLTARTLKAHESGCSHFVPAPAGLLSHHFVHLIPEGHVRPPS